MMMIDGDFFEDLSDIYWENINDIKENSLVYCETHNIPTFFNLINVSNIDTKFRLLSHNSDSCILKEDNKLYYVLCLNKFIWNKQEIIIPENIIKWYSQNMDIENDNFFTSLPIGLERKRWSNGNKHILIDNMKNISYEKEYLLYCNFTVRNNIDLRHNILEKVKTLPNVLIRNITDFKTYAEDIKKSKFVLCPTGNGIDTHRAWETLYLGSIPILYDNYHNRGAFENFKVMFIRNENDLDINILESFYSTNINNTNIVYEYDSIIKNKLKII